MKASTTKPPSSILAMEANKQILSDLLPLLITTIVFITVLQKLIRTRLSLPSDPNLPPGPRKLPILGNMHNIIGAPTHRRLTELAKTYGPLMHLKLGKLSMVVVTSPDVASQITRLHDLKYAPRVPKSWAKEAFMYRFKDVFASYGECWTQMKKVITAEVLSSRRVQSFQPLREAVMAKMVRELGESARSERPVNLSGMLYSAAFEILSGAAFGKTTADKYQSRLMGIVDKIGVEVNRFSIIDIFPAMRFLQVFRRSRSVLEKLYKEADEVFEEILAEHRTAKERRRACQEEEEAEEQLGLVDVLLNLQEHDQNEEFQISDESIKGVLMDLFAAGYVTVAMTTEWAMSEMLRNPRVLLKAQAEVRHLHDMKGGIHKSHLHDLKYLNQVIRENFRMHPTAPFLLPKEDLERSCEIKGYEIPAKALVFTNIWAIGRDPNIWKDPDAFDPERFHESSIDYKGAHFELLPFGAGRRICPGMALGVANVETTLANLLCHFDWKLPGGMKAEDLDMTEATGFVLKRKSELYLIPALPNRAV